MDSETYQANSWNLLAVGVRGIASLCFLAPMACRTWSSLSTLPYSGPCLIDGRDLFRRVSFKIRKVLGHILSLTLVFTCLIYAVGSMRLGTGGNAVEEVQDVLSGCVGHRREGGACIRRTRFGGLG